MGINYYHNLIDALIAAGIEPMVTMYHWDLPQAIQDLGGLTNPLFVRYFEQYARLLFEEYGSKVQYWITFNEPMEYCGSGYGSGSWPPAIHANGVGDYLCAHYTILAHARAYHLYKNEYYELYHGKVGITLNGGATFASNPDDPLDVAASDRSFQFSFGLYANPIFLGGYPQVVIDRVNANSLAEGRPWSRLPEFTPEEIEYVKGTSDFFGLNYYTSRIVQHTDSPWGDNPSRSRDESVHAYTNPDWPSANGWLYSFPYGLRFIIK